MVDEPEPAAAVDLTEDVESSDEAAVAEAEGDAPPPADEVAEAPEGVDQLFARLKASQGTEVAQPEAGSGSSEPPGPSDEVVAEAEEEAEAEVEAPAPEAPGGVPADADLLSLLERRDGSIEPIESRIARKLKRALADEQGSVLDHVRRERGRVDLASALPPEVQLDAYAAVVTEELGAAAEEGAGFEGGSLPSGTAVDDLAADLARDLAAVVRPKVERCFEAGDDADDTSDRLRATYREWKTDRLVEVTRHHVLAAFGRGQAAVRPIGEPVRWVPDPSSPACPDCEDDALAGSVPAGDAFPTGHVHPPAHPGCRCLLVAVRVATPA